MAKIVPLLLCMSVLAWACSEEEAASTSATATLSGKGESADIAGTTTFRKRGDETELTLTLTGAPPGAHGAHIHENGSCDDTDAGVAAAAGGHWNPGDHEHGEPSAQSHLGDLGNIEVGEDGTGTLTLSSPRMQIGTGADTDVVGKAVVIHAGEDDLTSQPSGDSGSRIACGVIR